MNKKPKILVWDIETSFNIVAAFSLFNEHPINHRNILQERHIISVSWKWLGEKKVHSISVADDGARFAVNPHDDFPILDKMHELFEEADAVVHHYGDKFDLPMINARMVFHGLPPLPPIVQIDTKKIASKYFRFNSNRLDYLGIFLNVGKKIDTDPGLWMRCLKGEKKAVEEMVVYNKEDVRLLERVYLKLRPFAKVHINQQLFRDKDDVCPTCGGNHLQYRGFRYTITRKYRRFQCLDCRHWGASRKHEPIIKGNN
jgi:hypothetical protein